MVRDDNHNLVPDAVEDVAHKATTTVTHEEKKILKLLRERREAAIHKFPLLFTLLGTFGFVATLYGFEHLINGVPFLVDNPVVMLGTGLVVLVFTGTLYKKLS